MAKKRSQQQKEKLVNRVRFSDVVESKERSEDEQGSTSSNNDNNHTQLARLELSTYIQRDELVKKWIEDIPNSKKDIIWPKKIQKVMEIDSYNSDDSDVTNNSVQNIYNTNQR